MLPDHRLDEVASLLRPGVPARVESFPDTPTGWAHSYGLNWAEVGESCVIRLTNPSVLAAEEVRTEFAAAALMGEHGIGPAIRYLDARTGVLVMDRIDGAPARPARDWQAISVAGLLSRLHALPWNAQLKLHERKWHAARRAVHDQVRGIPRLALFGRVLGAFDCLRRGLSTLAVTNVLCHNDLNPGNILFDGARAWLVDYDHVGRADPLFDVATTIEALDLNDALTHCFLEEYLGKPSEQGQLARLELLRCLVLLRYGLTTLALVPESSYPRLASWDQADIGEPFVFDRPDGEEFGWSVFRLSLGFATAGLRRLRAERNLRAARILRMEDVLEYALGRQGEHAYGDATAG